MGVNKTTHIGNCAEPEIIQASSGIIAKFGLAINESYNNKQGEKIDNTEWFNVVCYNKIAEIVEKYIKKGQQLCVLGKLQNNKWVDKDGNNRNSVQIKVDGFDGTRIEMLGSKSDNQPTNQPQSEEDGLPY